MEYDLIVTRHPALVEYLQNQGLVSADIEVVVHTTPEVLEGKNVIGILPLNLAAVCQTVTTIPLNLPAELRGVELSLEQVQQYAGTPQVFEVQDVTSTVPVSA